MKKLLMVLAMACGLVAPASATKIIYINNQTGSDGTGGHDGTTPAKAWRTMQYANATLGDGVTGGDIAAEDIVVLMAPTTAQGFTVPPNPIIESDSTFRYYFYGDIANPSAVVMVGGDINLKYSSIRGVRFSSILSLENGAQGDTIADFVCSSSAYVTIHGGDWNWIGRGTQGGNDFTAFRGAGTVSRGNTFSSVAWPNIGVGHTGLGHLVDLGGEGNCATGCGRALDNTIERSRLTFTMVNEGDGSKHFWMNYVNRNFTLKYCRVEFNGSFQQMGIHLRDSSGFTMIGDTIIARGTACNLLISDGAGVAEFAGKSKPLSIDSCYIVNEAGDGIVFRDGRSAPFTATHSLIMAGGKAIDFQQPLYAKVTIRRCTILGNPYEGVVKIDQAASQPAWVDTVKIMDNIIGSQYPGYSGMHSPGSCGDRSTPGCYWWAFMVYGAKMDSLRASGGAVSRKHIINFNTYSYFGDSIPNTGDRSITYSGYNCSRPGSGAAGWFFAAYKQDSASRYGGAKFDKGEADTTMASFLDPANASWEIGEFSIARGAASGGADCGARSYQSGTADGIVTNNASMVFEYGTAASSDFTVKNNGTGTMTVTSVTSDNTAYFVTPQTASIATGNSQVFTCVYNGTGLGSANLVVVSNSISVVSAIAQILGQYGGSTSKFPSGDEPPSP